MPLKSLISQSLEAKAAPTPFGDTSFQLINGKLVSYPDNFKTYIDKGYSANDIIYSIIKLITDKIRVAPWNMYKVKDESSYKSLIAMQQKKNWTAKDYSIISGLQKKALEVVKDAGKWGDLLKFPNQRETFTDFVANGCAFKLLTGNKYIWASMIDKGVNSGTPAELHNLPSQYMEIFVDGSFPANITGYQFNQMRTAKYAPELILHEADFNPDWSVNGSQIYGVSPLKAALKRLNKNNSMIDAETNTFQNEGIKALIALRNEPGKVGEEETDRAVSTLSDMMRNQWSGVKNRNRIGIAGYAVDVHEIGLNSEEMQMIESGKMDIRMFCNVWGVPSQLMNDPDNKAHNNVEEAEKALTTRCALPQLVSFREQMNRKGHLHWGMKENMVIDFDMTAYTELQADMADMMVWIEKLVNKGLPLNRAMDLLNLEKVDSPLFDEPWITPGMGQPLSEWELNEVDNTLANENDI